MPCSRTEFVTSTRVRQPGLTNSARSDDLGDLVTGVGDVDVRAR